MDEQIKGTIESCYQHVRDAYDKLESLGATMPTEKNIENLRPTIYTLDLDIDKYKVTFDDGETQTVEEVYPGQSVVKPADPVQVGKKFLYWYEQTGSSYDPENPTLEGLKSALNAGVLDNVEIGTEIPDKWNGVDSPLIVGTKQAIMDANGVRHLAIGLTRKFIDTSSIYGANTNDGRSYKTSTILSYLNNDYLDKCSDELKGVVADVTVSWYSNMSSTHGTATGKVHLLSNVEVYGTGSNGEGYAWELWKNRANITAPNNSANNGRIVYNSSGVAQQWWLRTMFSTTGDYYMEKTGAVSYTTSGASLGVLPEFWIIADESLPESSLASLKEALDGGYADIAYPVGMEIEDTYDGHSNPLIVAQYLDESNNSRYGGAEGVICIRKYANPLSQQFNTSTSATNYDGSLIQNFLNTTYLEKCSDNIRNTVSKLIIPWNNGTEIVGVESKFFLMSKTEIKGTTTTSDTSIGFEGIGWQYWIEKTGLFSGSNNANSGRIVRDISNNAQAWWTRSKDGSNIWHVIGTGEIKNTSGASNTIAVVPACFISKD